MRRYLLATTLILMTLPSVGCCYRMAGCDPCTGVAYGGGYEPCVSPCSCLNNVGNCLFGWMGCGCFNNCCDPCCGSAGYPAPVSPGWCAPGQPYLPGPGTIVPSSPTVVPPSSSSIMTTPQISMPPLSVPQAPTPIPQDEISYISPQVSPGLTVAGPPARGSKVYEQAAVSPWINAK